MNKELIEIPVEQEMDTSNTGVKRKSISTEEITALQENKWKGLCSLYFNKEIKRKHRNFTSEEEVLSTLKPKLQ